ncbi:MAG: hypothetical protein M3Z92_15870 [Bacteroidota bacterium]|nr:hypothetical protein [Bacteroidota bacterium]MDQ6889338.1 hypothetical protein [Bacteroidota bacterium]
MENFYSAYVRTVNGDAFYFVKKYQLFPELKDVPPILDSYAMHTNFEKACKIAMIFDKAIQKQLMTELQENSSLSNLQKTERAKARIYKLIPRHLNFPSIFKSGWLGKVSYNNVK